MLLETRNKRKKPLPRLTMRNAELRKKYIELRLMNWLSIGVLGLFALSVLTALVAVILRGFRIIDISDTVLLSLLGHSVFQTAPALGIILRFVFSRPN